MVVAVSPMTAAEYLATPEDRRRHTELINGMIVVNEPKLPHSFAQTELVYALRRWIDAGDGRGYVSTPNDVPIDDRNVYAPDVWWISEDRRPTPGQLDLTEMPDLVIEIRSASTWARDLSVKIPAYARAGVAEAWFVDTQSRTVFVFRRSDPDARTFDVTAEVDSDEMLTSPMRPCFKLVVAAIFDS